MRPPPCRTGRGPAARKAWRSEQYADGRGPFPERAAVLQLTSRFLTDFYLLVGDWATWAAGIVATWPDDPSQVSPDPAVLTETLRRAAVGGQRQGGRLTLELRMRPGRADAEAARRNVKLDPQILLQAIRDYMAT